MMPNVVINSDSQFAASITFWESFAQTYKRGGCE